MDPGGKGWAASPPSYEQLGRSEEPPRASAGPSQPTQQINDEGLKSWREVAQTGDELPPAYDTVFDRHLDPLTREYKQAFPTSEQKEFPPDKAAAPIDKSGLCEHWGRRRCQLTGTKGVCCECADQRMIKGNREPMLEKEGMAKREFRWWAYCPSCQEYLRRLHGDPPQSEEEIEEQLWKEEQEFKLRNPQVLKLPMYDQKDHIGGAVSSSGGGLMAWFRKGKGKARGYK